MLPPIPPINITTTGDTTVQLSESIHLNATGTYGCSISQVHGKIVPKRPTDVFSYVVI